MSLTEQSIGRRVIGSLDDSHTDCEVSGEAPLSVLGVNVECQLQASEQGE